jgi:hypothetical protein
MSLTRQPDELGAEARAIIAAARGAHEPNEISRARVNRSLELKLAAGAALVIGPAASALAGVLKVTLVVASVGAVVGAGVYALPRQATRPPARHTTARPAFVPRIAAPPPAPAPSPPAAEPAPEVLPTIPAPARPRHHARALARPAAPESAASLREETALLAAANEALGSHRVERALTLLEDYDRRASAGGLPGLLAEERAATGILALCAADRPEAARVEARRFRARWPRSPLAARIDGSCAGRLAGRSWPPQGTAPTGP